MSMLAPPNTCATCVPRMALARLASMKSVALPSNQLALMCPASCQTVADRSQSAVSRHSSQFCRSSVISAFADQSGLRMFCLSPSEDVFEPDRCPAEPAAGGVVDGVGDGRDDAD